MGPCIHWCIPCTWYGDLKNSGNAFCNRSLPSNLPECNHHDRWCCTYGYGWHVKNVDEKTKNDQVTDGTSVLVEGMIAGEGLVGIALAILAVAGISLDVSGVVKLWKYRWCCSHDHHDPDTAEILPYGKRKKPDEKRIKKAKNKI